MLSNQDQANGSPADDRSLLLHRLWAVFIHSEHSLWGVVGDRQRNTCPSSKAGGGGHVGVAGTVARPLLFPLCHLTMATSNTLAGLR